MIVFYMKHVGRAEHVPLACIAPIELLLGWGFLLLFFNNTLSIASLKKTNCYFNYKTFILFCKYDHTLSY